MMCRRCFVGLLFSVEVALAVNAQLVDKVELYSGLSVRPSGTMPVDAHNWRKGDVLFFEPLDMNVKGFKSRLTIESDTTALVTLPRRMREGEYQVTLHRGSQQQCLGKTFLRVPDVFPHGTPVAAHRAVWDAPGSAPNSRKSVSLAIDLGIHACEIDVWRTTDGKLIVNHDAVFQGILLQNASYEEVKPLRLSNGETIPLLSEMLDMIKPADVKLNLMIEIKRNKSEEQNMALVEDVVRMIKDYGLQDNVCLLSLGYTICERLVQLLPECTVYYIEHMTRDTTKRGKPYYEGPGIVPFPQLKASGITGISLGPGLVFVRHPEWVEQSRGEGLKLSCCVVSDPENIIKSNNLNADILVTNTPVLAQRIYLHYKRNQ